MNTYSYAVESGQSSKYFTSEKLLGKEGEVVSFGEHKFFILVIDGYHVQCLGNLQEFPQDKEEHEILKTKYFEEADNLRDDD